MYGFSLNKNNETFYGFPKSTNPTPIGRLFTDTFDRASLGSNWTTVGSPTVSLDGSGDMSFSGGAGNFSNYIYYNAYATDLEDVDVSINFKINSAINTTNYGVTIGFNSISTYDTRKLQFQMTFYTGHTGELYFWNNGSLIITGGHQLTVALNDEINFTVKRRGLVYTAIGTNLTNYQTHSITQTFSQVYSQSLFVNLSSNIALYAMGGTQLIHDITLTSYNNKYPDLYLTGDSIGSGLYSNTNAGFLDGRFINIISSRLNKSFTARCGPSEGIKDDVTSISQGNESSLIYPKQAIIFKGTNDILKGRSLSQMQSDYVTLINSINTKNILHCLAIPRNGIDVRPWNNWLKQNYNYVDTNSPFNDGNNNLVSTFNCGDNIHPNIAGQARLADIIGNRVKNGDF